MANTTKTHDLVVVTGEYQSGGQTKKRYENIGSVMKNENGSFLILKRTFNPAGVPNTGDRDSIMVSMFEPRAGQGNDQRNQGGGNQGGGGSGYGGGGQPSAGDGFSDSEIPFAPVTLI